jgi:hypothetical protein
MLIVFSLQWAGWITEAHVLTSGGTARNVTFIFANALSSLTAESVSVKNRVALYSAISC